MNPISDQLAPQPNPNRVNRLAKWAIPLVAIVALNACQGESAVEEPALTHPETTTSTSEAPENTLEKDPEVTTVPEKAPEPSDPFEMITSPEQSAYFESSQRNKKIHGEVGVLFDMVADLENKDGYIGVSVDANEDGGLTAIYDVYNAQGDLISVTVSGREAGTGSTRIIKAPKGDIGISPDSLTISMIPAEHIGNEYYAYSADAGFTLNDEITYTTTLRTELDVPSEWEGAYSRYYTVQNGYTLDSTVGHENLPNGSTGISLDVELAKAVDERAYERARQLLLTIPTEDSPLDFSYSPRLSSAEIHKHENPVQPESEEQDVLPAPTNTSPELN